jgi:hypothetical protein
MSVDHVIRLDEAARAYGIFLRSLRLLRASIAVMSGAFVIMPLRAVSFMMQYNYSWSAFVIETSAALICSVVILYGELSLFYFLAAASVRAAWVVILFEIVLALAILGPTFPLLLSKIFLDAITFPSPNNIFGLLAILFPLYFSYLLVIGPVQIVRYRRSPVFPLFADCNYRYGFWLGWTNFFNNFRLMMRIPASGPAKGRGWVVIMAVSALLIEGYAFHFYWLNNALQEAGKSASELLTGVVIPLVGVATILFPLSRWLRNNARRRALLSADEARLTDPRRPVLFLRSFRDDQVSLANAKRPWFMRFLDPGTIAGTLEGLIIQEHSYLGPVVAIGNPSDQLPPLGVARKYCHGGDEWHEIVQSLMDEAAMIIVGVERSEGINWEVTTIRQKGLLAKTIFILPPHHPAKQDHLIHLLRLLDAHTDVPDLPLGSVALCLAFPVPNCRLLLVSGRITELEYELALRAPRLIQFTNRVHTNRPSPGGPS